MDLEKQLIQQFEIYNPSALKLLDTSDQKQEPISTLDDAVNHHWWFFVNCKTKLIKYD